MDMKPPGVICLSPRFRFGVAALLSVTACAACYVAGRKHGFDEVTGLLVDAPPVTRVYDAYHVIDVSGTGEPPTSINDVVAQIEKEMTRADSYGSVLILGDPKYGVVQVSTREIAHGRIRRLLSRMYDATR